VTRKPQFKIADVSPSLESLGGPRLSPTNGVFKTDQGTQPFDQLLLGHWYLEGTINLDISATAYVFLYPHGGTTYLLAETIIGDLAKNKWSAWRTYRIDVESGVTFDVVRDEVECELKHLLCSVR